MQIKAVVSKESLKGYIYIEAYKQTHVKQAIEGIGNLRLGQWSQMVGFSLRYKSKDFFFKFSIA